MMGFGPTLHLVFCSVHFPGVALYLSQSDFDFIDKYYHGS